MVEGIDEDKITAEIEDLQHKLGVLQANIDKVLNEVRVYLALIQADVVLGDSML